MVLFLVRHGMMVPQHPASSQVKSRSRSGVILAPLGGWVGVGGDWRFAWKIQELGQILMAMQQEPIDWRYLPYIFGLFFRPM